MTIPAGQPASLTFMQPTPIAPQRLRLLFAAVCLFLPDATARAQDPPLRDLLRDGLYAEEVTRDAEAAIITNKSSPATPNNANLPPPPCSGSPRSAAKWTPSGRARALRAPAGKFAPCSSGGSPTRNGATSWNYRALMAPEVLADQSGQEIFKKRSKNAWLPCL